MYNLINGDTSVALVASLSCEYERSSLDMWIETMMDNFVQSAWIRGLFKSRWFANICIINLRNLHRYSDRLSVSTVTRICTPNRARKRDQDKVQKAGNCWCSLHQDSSAVPEETHRVSRIVRHLFPKFPSAPRLFSTPTTDYERDFKHSRSLKRSLNKREVSNLIQGVVIFEIGWVIAIGVWEIVSGRKLETWVIRIHLQSSSRTRVNNSSNKSSKMQTLILAGCRISLNF